MRIGVYLRSLSNNKLFLNSGLKYSLTGTSLRCLSSSSVCNNHDRIVIRIPSKALPKTDSIVKAAISSSDSPANNITIEVPDSEKHTLNAVGEAIDKHNTLGKHISVLVQCGYRNKQSDSNGSIAYEGDVPIEENGHVAAVHNLSPEYLEMVANSCSVIKGLNEKIDVILLTHDPEIQLYQQQLVGQGGNNDILINMCSTLEKACRNGKITSYGVSSNGMSLPPKHPLYFPWEVLLKYARNAIGGDINQRTLSKLSTIQLPINLLERRGLAVSQQIREFSHKPESHIDIEILASRPLTCYPDGGVGSGLPFKLVDYRIEGDSQGGMRWTHEIPECPFQYAPALNAAMGHFDAEDLILMDQEGERMLTVEERETLEGCRLLQSMLSDLDLSLLTMRSFEAYEKDLVAKVIPMIHSTFEELDEESATILQVRELLIDIDWRFLYPNNSCHM